MSDLLYGYAGGKTRLKPYILNALSRFPQAEYREPFFGGGAIGLHMVQCFDGNIWINDKDPGIHAIWQAVLRFPQQLKALVRRFMPSTGAFHKLKAFLLNNPVTSTVSEMVFVAFAKLAVHLISFSGLGVMASSRTQEWIDKKWSASSLCKKIDSLHASLTRKDVRITNADYSELIADDSVKALLYLDPPYFDKGPECYQHSFKYKDHERLSELLKKTIHKWVMSYDDCYAARKLYGGWSHIETIPVRYSINGLVNKTELLISCD